MLKIDWHSQKNVVSRVTGSKLANRSEKRQHKINEDRLMNNASPWRATIYTYFGLTLPNKISHRSIRQTLRTRRRPQSHTSHSFDNPWEFTPASFQVALGGFDVHVSASMRWENIAPRLLIQSS